MTVWMIGAAMLAGMTGLLQAETLDNPVCSLPDLPEAHTNNGVASLTAGDKTYVVSFLGLKSGKTWQDTSRAGFMLTVGEPSWTQLDPVPVPEGRLASVVQAVGGKFYIFGGYTVAEDGAEKSAPEVFAFDPVTRQYERKADMIIPVDDAVGVVYKDRYVYLISGWHDVGNVSFIHMYDTQTDTWVRVTDFAGKPVFGHGGGIAGNQIVISDGVAVVGIEDGRRAFATFGQGWQGTINSEDPTEIVWKKLPALPGNPLYRTAALGDASGERVVFAGGSATAYNYNGVGYDGSPASPSAHVYAWDVKAQEWVVYGDKKIPTMDHRALVEVKGSLFTVGGMVADQIVTGGVHLAVPSDACKSVLK